VEDVTTLSWSSAAVSECVRPKCANSRASMPVVPRTEDFLVISLRWFFIHVVTFLREFSELVAIIAAGTEHSSTIIILLWTPAQRKRMSMLYFANVYLFVYLFYGRLILRPWLTEVRESFTRGGPCVSLEKLLLGFFPRHP